jgi:hypothetical protein
MQRAPLSGAVSAIAVLIVLIIVSPALVAQANIQGQWSTLPNLMPINPVHVALLRTGKVLVVSGSGNVPTNLNFQAGIWDPQTGTTTTQPLSWDMFCNGMVVLPDGRVFVNSGTLQYDPFRGDRRSAIYDPSTNVFTTVENMAHGRWYPTVTTLGDGRVMTFSGLNDTTGATNQTVEIYTVGTGWSAEFSAPFTPPLYPRMHLLPNGKVFDSGPATSSHLFDPATKTWTTNIAHTNYSNSRTYGTSVLLPLTPANNYRPSLIIMGGGNPATPTTEVIDLGAASPAWQFGPNMSAGRIEMNATILPNGKVLAMGGSSSDEDESTASFNADLYDPATNSFSSASANTIPRVYHSVSLLLPDATVWLAGGNYTRGTYKQQMEIYKPAYLFTLDGSGNVVPATRPTITSAPATTTYGGAFTVQTPDASDISSVVLVRPGSATHAFDQDQRLVGVSFTTGFQTLTVTAPANGNIAPPGYYMLFILNSAGVPSIAKFVRIASNPAPTVASISPNAGPGTGGTAVTITGTGFLAGATVSFGATAATGVNVVSNTSITATTPAHAAGAVNVVVTNSDGRSGTLTNGYTYNTTNPAPTVTGVSPTSGSASGGTAVTISGTGFLAGATVSFGGTAATGVSVVSGTSITATTPAHAAGPVNVVVTNPDTMSGTFTNGFTYNVVSVPIGFAQVAASTPQSPVATLSTTFPGAQTAGNLNVIVVGWNDAVANVTGVTDNQGNTYSLAIGPTRGTNLSQSIYYAKNIKSGTNTVTVTFNQAAVYVDMRILEYAGLSTTAPLDVTAGASGSSTTPSSGSATTTSANELIFGANTVWTHNTGPGANFTTRIITSPDGDIAEDRVVTTTGSYSATAPVTPSGPWVMQMATFRAVGSNPNPAPTVSGISPTSGTTAGGTVVTISGTGFLSGATVTIGGATATGVNVVSGTSITATTPAHTAGAVNIIVTNSDSQSTTLANGYTYVSPNPAPTVGSVSPASGATAGGTAVTITGTGFLTGASVSFGGTAATGVSVVSGTSITATTPARAAGAVTVVVTNTDGQSGSGANAYTYVNPVPTVASVSPNAGPGTGGTAVTITGSGFLTGATVSFGGTAATGVSVVSSTSITATAPAHTAGAVNVVVTNSDGQSATLNNGYTYNPSNPAPTVTAISPTSGTTAGGTAVTITGTGFLSGATVSFGGTAATGVTVVSGTSISATTPAHAAGAVTIVVTNTDSQSGSRANAYTYVNPAPTIASISPNSGPGTGGTAVTITGTGFLTGATVSFGGTAATGVSVVSSTSITATAPAHAAGAVNVVVANNDGQSATLTNGYTYNTSNPAPTVTAISPTSGPTGGGTAVTITGTGFLAGATVSFNGTAATGVNVVNSTSITATTPAHSAGAVNVVVTNTDTKNATLTNGFTYNAVSVPIGFAQVAASTPQSPVSTLSTTFPGAQTAGNLNVIVVGWNDATSNVTGVTDTQGNTYSLAIGPTRGTNLSQSIYYARNIKSGNNTVTVTFNQAAVWVDVRILEYAGLSTTSPLDVTVGASGNSAAPSSGSATTTAPNELIFGANTVWTGNTVAGPSFTIRIITSPDGDLAEDRVVTTTGSYSASSTLWTGGPWVMQMVTFKP